MVSKEQARGHFRELRRNSAATDRAKPAEVLLACAEVKNGKIIASFLSYGDEPETAALNDELRRQGKVLLLPELNSDKSLTWLNEGEKVGLEILQSVDVVIIPALAIDRRGVRLGQGGGSFDRALLTLSGWKVALIESLSLTNEELPEEAHDIRVDAAATELGITRFH